MIAPGQPAVLKIAKIFIANIQIADSDPPLTERGGIQVELVNLKLAPARNN